jgi:hypothetical protein
MGRLFPCIEQLAQNWYVGNASAKDTAKYNKLGLLVLI